jgi:hypothetical protein
MSARYIPDTAKALEVILWLATECPGIDVYHVVKCAYYADKRHLNLYGRPSPAIGMKRTNTVRSENAFTACCGETL